MDFVILLIWQNFCFEQNGRCKYKCIWYDDKNKWIKNINKTQMIANVNLMVEYVIQVKSGIKIDVEVTVKI